MLARRSVLAGSLAMAVAARPAQAASFEVFLASIRAEARAKGIRDVTLDRALTNLHPNQKAIELDRHQPEFTFTWEQYRGRIVSAARVARGRELYSQQRKLLDEIAAHYGVPAGIIMGIWGLESNYGQSTGGFNVIEALATLAWDGRRAAFFRSELLDALRILDHGDITPERMTGSYAGAMGQTQFMPDSFLKYAVSWGNTGGRRDIWGDLGCVFASTANYLAREGWQAGLPWGERVTVPAGLSPYEVGREHRRPVGEWVARGVRPVRVSAAVSPATSAAVLLPGGTNADAYFAYYPSFLAIRRYNPSDFYCICVGLIGDQVTA